MRQIVKSLVITLLLLALASVVYSQSLQVIDTRYSHNLKIGEELKTSIKLKNISDKPIHVLVRRDEMLIGSSQETRF